MLSPVFNRQTYCSEYDYLFVLLWAEFILSEVQRRRKERHARIEAEKAQFQQKNVKRRNAGLALRL